jgi:hypothetical protein
MCSTGKAAAVLHSFDAVTRHWLSPLDVRRYSAGIESTEAFIQATCQDVESRVLCVQICRKVLVHHESNPPVSQADRLAKLAHHTTKGTPAYQH